MAIELNQIWDFPIKEFHPFPRAMMGPGAHEMVGPEALKMGFKKVLLMSSGLRGTDISLAARIVAVADVFDVMTSVRSYKAARPASEARAELARCAGSHFDPAVVRAFMSLSLGRLRLTMGPLSWLTQLSLFPQQMLASASASAGGATVGATAASTAATAKALGGCDIAYRPPTEHQEQPAMNTAEAIEKTRKLLALANSANEHEAAAAAARAAEIMERHRITAAMVAEAGGIPVSLDARFREIHAGQWQGMNNEGVARLFPEQRAAVLRGEDGAQLCPSPVDACLDVLERAPRPLRDLLVGEDIALGEPLQPLQRHAVQAPEVPLRLMFPIKAGVVAATVEVLPILETV